MYVRVVKYWHFKVVLVEVQIKYFSLHHCSNGIILTLHRFNRFSNNRKSIHKLAMTQ